jgi:uncharacterized protein (TIGR02996 family)
VARPPADDEQALTRQVIENPSDDTVRLVLADWFDENARSQSDRDRAEFICGQIWGAGKTGQGRTGLG